MRVLHRKSAEKGFAIGSLIYRYVKMEKHRETKPASPTQMRQWFDNKGIKQSNNHSTGIKDRIKIPEKLGKFHITGELGSGGMGQVYKGHHPDLDIPIAIKTIKKDLSKHPSFVDRFFREARLATKLNHPNVVRIYDVDKADDICFIVQEFVDGDDLQKILDAAENNRLAPNIALNIVTEITKALIEAEKFKIVHRDIKPGNILITRDSVPKLADLGLAKQYLSKESGESEKIALTRSISSFGSPAYMAPEQVVDAKNVDIRADIYSLGATFYHIVTGEIPFSGNSAEEIMAKKIHEEPPAPSQVNHELPARLSRVISKMIARNPVNRYQSPLELLAELEELQKPKDTKKRMLMLAVIALAISLVVSLFFSANNEKSEITPTLQVERYLSKQNFDQAQIFLEGLQDKYSSNDKLLYALGLCIVSKNEQGKLPRIIKELENLSNGWEKAKHLEVLQHLSRDNLESALLLIDEWLPKVSSKLPFFQSRGIALQKLGKSTEAKISFEKALLEEAYFDFQKLEVIDHLARLCVKYGKLEQANSLYSEALDSYSSSWISPAFYTNYAVTLMNNGQLKKAIQILNRISHPNSKDEMVLYLQNRILERTNQSRIIEINNTMAMIDDVNQLITQKADHRDKWTSTPRILAFLPLENRSSLVDRLGIENYWTDELIRLIRKKNNFPVVNRDALDHILGELKLNASELGSSEVSLKLGSLLPASILISGSFTENREEIGLILRLIDVQTSEVIAVVKEAFENHARDKLFKTVNQELIKALQDNFPIKGRVSAGEGDFYEINIGKYHGLKEGQSVRVYKPKKNVSARLLSRQKPFAKATVSEVNKFSSLIRINKTSKTVVRNMLVLANAR